MSTRVVISTPPGSRKASFVTVGRKRGVTKAEGGKVSERSDFRSTVARIDFEKLGRDTCPWAVQKMSWAGGGQQGGTQLYSCAALALVVRCGEGVKAGLEKLAPPPTLRLPTHGPMMMRYPSWATYQPTVNGPPMVTAYPVTRTDLPVAPGGGACTGRLLTHPGTARGAPSTGWGMQS